MGHGHLISFHCKTKLKCRNSRPFQINVLWKFLARNLNLYLQMIKISGSNTSLKWSEPIDGVKINDNSVCPCTCSLLQLFKNCYQVQPSPGATSRYVRLARFTFIPLVIVLQIPTNDLINTFFCFPLTQVTYRCRILINWVSLHWVSTLELEVLNALLPCCSV